jgi:hypothetical protein
LKVPDTLIYNVLMSIKIKNVTQCGKILTNANCTTLSTRTINPIVAFECGPCVMYYHENKFMLAIFLCFGDCSVFP